ncbi:MAG: hypothetical protein HN995_02590 [Candidatus Marinimicrobia bacterium]|nr:hypothetical protein [Candidatus Neomarinimicrobiota bacterium]MBT3576224.1 hypothetical protein [Candidatus Neomarinimicrobiota bacterium]MBT3679504.1 hypothetical protein [Candidatus Neomarinimicrobiota bacterium]MBT3950369.1 hypothetical protein [Candidatus Neomarinimicrobiota bacterium]MBT4253806.1 hypothetical protein [Candidatus Neomarinimicrobiota bacterium]
MFKQLNARSAILLVILLAAMLYGLFDAGIIGSGNGDVDNLFGLATGGSSEPASAREVSDSRTAAPLRSLVWNGGWESDPFFYAEAETTNALGGGILGSLFGSIDGDNVPSLDLTGISWVGNVGMALINGDILEEGDRVAGYQITKIAFDHIILRRGTSIVKVNMDE